MAARVPLPILPASFKKKKQRDDVKLEEAENLIPLEEERDQQQNETQRQHAEVVDEDEEEEDEDMTLDEHAMVVMAILKPVAVTMMLVIAIVYALNMADAPPSTVSFMIYQEKSSDSAGVKFGGALLDAAVFVAMIVVVTFVLVLLYKYRCLKIIYNWLMLSVAMLLGVFGGALYYHIFVKFNWPLDWITFSVIIFNFAVVGMFSIFWRAPTKTTQAYLVVISALMACFFTRLAEWTTWTLLISIAIYDLFAVLCPRGPLKMLVDLSQERGEPIPALLYNGSVVCVGTMASSSTSSPSSSDNETEELLAVDSPAIQEQEEIIDSSEDLSTVPLLQQDETQENENSESAADSAAALDPNDKLDYYEHNEGGSVKLGLGDFIFYSVLMGRAAMYDITTVFTCFIAIITGLFFTLILLAIFRKALPALPISIFLGAIFYFVTNTFLVPYVQILGSNGVFV